MQFLFKNSIRNNLIVKYLKKYNKYQINSNNLWWYLDTFDSHRHDVNFLNLIKVHF